MSKDSTLGSTSKWEHECLSLCSCILLSMFSRSIYLPAELILSFFFTNDNCIVHHYHIYITHSCVDGHRHFLPCHSYWDQKGNEHEWAFACQGGFSEWQSSHDFYWQVISFKQLSSFHKVVLGATDVPALKVKNLDWMSLTISSCSNISFSSPCQDQGPFFSTPVFTTLILIVLFQPLPHLCRPHHETAASTEGVFVYGLASHTISTVFTTNVSATVIASC